MSFNSESAHSNAGNYSSPTWQSQDTNTDWKPGYLSQMLFSNLGNPSNKMSGSFEGFYLNSGHRPWDIVQGIHDNSTDFVPSVGNKNHASFNNSNEARLILRVPPENRFRYRYDTEMSGTHGSLQGVRSGREKSVPTVELINYPFEALIRVTLVTCQENEHYPHPHSLFVREKLYQKKIYENWDGKRPTKTAHYSDPHYIRVGRLKNDYTASFEGMCIINSKKENFHLSVREKLRMRRFEVKQSGRRDESLLEEENESFIRRVETAVSAVDVDFVSLCFEAFKEDDGRLFPICQPVYSEPIGNAKSAKTGKLKISRINKCSGNCKGGDEIWLLVEKINKKGLVVRFSEEGNGEIIWESCIQGDDLILHHQYAIIFKTPPYRDVNIASEVEVLMRLERTTQPNQPCDYSEPITFVYEPSRSKTNKGENLFRKESILAPLKQFQTKRPRTESSSSSPFGHQTKRKTEEMKLERMDFEESDEDIEQLLFEGKDSFELDQAWGKFNVEEFLRFISADDMEMQLEKDGIGHSNKSRRDFFYKLYLMYSKLDENDMKKLTNQISDFRVSKKEFSECKSGMEKDQVKDAASTLLTLRSKALINNSNSINNNDDLMINAVVGGNKMDCSGRNLSHTKPELLSTMFEPCCEPDLEVQSPVHASVIHYNLTKFLSRTKAGKGYEDFSKGLTGERQSINCKVIKKEENSLDCLMNGEKMSRICEVLNANGSWRNLAEVWNCTEVVPIAKESSNPAKYIIEYVKQQVQGDLEFETLHNSLETINERKAVEILKEIFTENLVSFNKDL